MNKIITSYKTSVFGIALMIFSIVKYCITDTRDMTFVNFDAWFISISGLCGFALLFMGDIWINKIIDAIAHRIKGGSKNEN